MTDHDTSALPALRDLERGAVELGCSLNAHEVRRFSLYASAVHAENQRVNLTGAKTLDEIVRRLLLDSLALWMTLPRGVRDAEMCSLIDVGSGAGVPGVPIAILRPKWHVTLVDSISKKTRFLSTLPALLSLPHLAAVAGRAEELARGSVYRDSFDLVLARALAPLPALVELCAPFARPGAVLAFPKSGDIAAEIQEATAAAATLRLALDAVVPVPASAGLGDGHATVIYRKTAGTPRGFPRRTGLAQSRPLQSG